MPKLDYLITSNAQDYKTCLKKLWKRGGGCSCPGDVFGADKKRISLVYRELYFACIRYFPHVHCRAISRITPYHIQCTYLTRCFISNVHSLSPLANTPYDQEVKTTYNWRIDEACQRVLKFFLDFPNILSMVKNNISCWSVKKLIMVATQILKTKFEDYWGLFQDIRQAIIRTFESNFPKLINFRVTKFNDFGRLTVLWILDSYVMARDYKTWTNKILIMAAVKKKTF